MKILDVYELQQKDDKPINWVVEGILPSGLVGDVYGPPDEGKSTILSHLALSISSKQEKWFGRKIANGRVAIIGGEKSSEDAWVRDIHRIGAETKLTERGQMCIDMDDKPLWKFDKRAGEWLNTEEHKVLIEYLKTFEPVLVIIDTLSRATIGGNIIDYEQQSLLARKVEEIRHHLNTTIISISHTNQASASANISNRLHWMSRSGSSGLPGIFRWMAGVTRVKEDDDIEQLKSYNLQENKIVTFAVSKCNEIPPPLWNIYNPLVLHINGGIDLIGRVKIETKKKKKKIEDSILIDDTSAESVAEPEPEKPKRGRPFKAATKKEVTDDILQYF